ncbi:MAG: Squalene/phytoene desaturase HopC [Burkholderiaceae bacterium]|jgi:squalene-associated FAD-dependent desaturase|nr:MAG: Squalene/phytoene desaturase HopC [Burkholderiaceae bacterium]
MRNGRGCASRLDEGAPLAQRERLARLEQPDRGMKVAIVGGGWAGMAAAVTAAGGGHRVTVFEAARRPGGRARALPVTLPDGQAAMLDNGQHILIGAYRETLRLMRRVGVAEEQALLRLPLALAFADGSGLALRRSGTPRALLAALATARGWDWRDKLALLRFIAAWRRRGFRCAEPLTVAELGAPLTPRLRRDFLEPLCIAALNTPVTGASGRVLLRVLHDSLWAGRGGSDLLLPRVDLGALFPNPAARWLRANGGELRCGERVTALRPLPAAGRAPRWQIGETGFDRVVLATPPSDAANVLAGSTLLAPEYIASSMRRWTDIALALRYEAIATVFAMVSQAAPRTEARAAPVAPAMPDAGATLPRAMLALRAATGAAPGAQFVFDRGRLGGPPGLLAFVASACSSERAALQTAVAEQARTQLGLDVQPVQTVLEKRATFACSPGLARPPAQIAPGLLACGDYVAGPYPATLEAAVRSGVAAAGLL